MKPSVSGLTVFPVRRIPAGLLPGLRKVTEAAVTGRGSDRACDERAGSDRNGSDIDGRDRVGQRDTDKDRAGL